MIIRNMEDSHVDLFSSPVLDIRMKEEHHPRMVHQKYFHTLACERVFIVNSENYLTSITMDLNGE